MKSTKTTSTTTTTTAAAKKTGCPVCGRKNTRKAGHSPVCRNPVACFARFAA